MLIVSNHHLLSDAFHEDSRENRNEYIEQG